MRISSKKITIGSIFLATILGASAIIGLFINSNQVSNVIDTNIKKPVSDFFNKDDMGGVSGINFQLKKYLNKESILNLFTNYNSIHEYNNLCYNSINVKNNILSFMKKTISYDKKFTNIEDFYIKIRYTLLDKKLIIDVR